MSFLDLNIKGNYSSDDDAPAQDFYLPILREAVSYDRAVGFFSANMISYVLSGITKLAENDGRIRFIIGDELDDDTYRAVMEGYKQRANEKTIHDWDQLLRSDDKTLRYRLGVINKLISAGRIDIKMAYRRVGMFHQKFGVATDHQGNQIAFSGSMNDTRFALDKSCNSEEISVFKSWNREIFEEHGKIYIKRFSDLWEGLKPETLVVSVNSSVAESFRKYIKEGKAFPERPDKRDLGDEFDRYEHAIDAEIPTVPRQLGGIPFEIKQHQRDALVQWQNNKYRGIFDLATGAGKTITSIYGAVRLFETRGKLALVVAVPYVVLAEQWFNILKKFNIDAIEAYESQTNWLARMDGDIASYRIGTKKFIAIVVVNKTLVTEDFQFRLNQIPVEQLLFVGDECHHHKSEVMRKSIPNAGYMIGLSATPWRKDDVVAELALKKIYGPVVAKYTIDDALAEGVLTQYQYVMHKVDFTEEEVDLYLSLSKKISQLFALKESGALTDDVGLKSALLERLRILGSMENKFKIFKEQLSRREVGKHVLVYCGDGTTHTDVNEGESQPLRDINRAALILHNNGWRASRVTSDESNSLRRQIISKFTEEEINAIVAIRVLDEGFDIPSCAEAYLLASSRNERQYIQRRGRVLRKSEGQTSVTIHDYLVIPSRSDEEHMKKLVEAELVRAFEFARVASNSEEALMEINLIKDEWSIDPASGNSEEYCSD